MTARLPSEVVAVLGQFFPRVELAELRVTAAPQGFSGAQVWRVELPAAAFALRRWPDSGLASNRLRELHRLLRHLSDAGLSFVSVPVRSLTGETLVANGDRQWQLEPWLPGNADFHSDPNAQRLQSAMTALARWHAAAKTFRPAVEACEWFDSRPAAPSPAVTERWARLRQLSPPRVKQLRAAIQQEPDVTRRQLGCAMLDGIRRHRDEGIASLQSLSQERFDLQPCLRDIWHDHVLFAGNEVTGLIDPSACRVENVAADLARLLGSLVEDDAPQRQTALNAYRRHHPLTLAEEALVVALDRSGVLLSALTWLEWLYIEQRPFPNLALVEERLVRLHRRLQSM